MRKRGTPRGKTETDTGPADSPPRRSLRLLKILILLYIMVVVGELVYHLFHWKDIIRAVREATVYEFAFAVLLGMAYFAYKRWSDRS